MVRKLDHDGIYAAASQEAREKRELIKIAQLAVPAMNEQNGGLAPPVFASTKETAPREIILRRRAGKQRWKAEVDARKEFRLRGRDATRKKELRVGEESFSFSEVLGWTIARAHTGARGTDRQPIERFSETTPHAWQYTGGAA